MTVNIDTVRFARIEEEVIDLFVFLGQKLTSTGVYRQDTGASVDVDKAALMCIDFLVINYTMSM